jgi:Mg2+ and Co2+ transporter CorA
MQILHVDGETTIALGSLPATLPPGGYLWVATGRHEFAAECEALQAALQRWTGGQIVDLHVSDLLNEQLTSNFDYTSWYEILVFRRLALDADRAPPAGAATLAGARAALEAIDTSPVGFVLFDRVLLTVHPPVCPMREYFASRLLSQAASTDARASARTPPSAADLLLRMVNHLVDRYLELRRLLSRQLETVQQRLFDPRCNFAGWPLLMASRNTLHQLEEICEDQRAAIVEWIDGLDEASEPADADARRAKELLRVRSRDVLEHIERVVAHVKRLQATAETAMQIHFSAQNNRTNDIMRTLTVLTAIFLPLNFVTGFFGMNFEGLPLIHSADGFWLTFATMLALGVGLSVYFWRKRYIGETR